MDFVDWGAVVGWATGSAAVQGVALLAAIVAMVLWHRDPKAEKFDLMDVLIEDGAISGRKLFEAGCFLMTSIWYMGRVMSGQADLAETLGFAGLWTVARTAGQIIHSQNAQKGSGGAK